MAFFKPSKLSFLIKLKVCCLFFIVLIASKVHAAHKLSPQAQVSLITISPGSDLYAAFGHSTLWVLDGETGVDRVYNYGTFDFNQPNFYLNFVRGHLDYSLSVYPFEDQYASAMYEGRGITQQVLELDSLQKQRIYDFLEWNALPANNRYLYDFYLDNCSSRLRDVLQNACGKALVYDSKIATPYSFREWMNLFLVPHPWSALGMNIGLGAPSDRQTNYLTQMYLPINLKLGISTASLSGHVLTKGETEILPSVLESDMESHSVWVFVCLVFVLAIVFCFSKGRFAIMQNIFDLFLMLLVFLLGIVLALLWFATNHWVCAWNTDLLWANPLVLSYIGLYTALKNNTVLRISCYATLLLSFAYFTVAYLLPEKPLLVLFPFIMALQLRVYYRLQNTKTPAA
jgi:hypothetical protein